MKRHPERSLKIYLIGIALIALLSTLGHFQVQRITTTDDVYASIINLSGRQRMLSQQVTLRAQTAVLLDSDDAREKLQTSISEMRAAHEALANNAPHPALPRLPPESAAVDQIFFGEPDLDNQVRRFLSNADSIQNNTGDPAEALSTLRLLSEGTLLQTLESLVQTYEGMAIASAEKASRLETLLWIATLILLVIEWFVIFRPQHASITDAIATIKKQKNDMQQRQTRFVLAAQTGAFGIWERPDTRSDAIVFTETFTNLFEDDGSIFPVNCEGFLERVHPEDRAFTQKRLFRNKPADGERVMLEHRLLATDGTYRWFSTLAEYRRSEETGTYGMIACTTDIHGQKAAERATSEFISTMNHELRTPLTSILGALRLLMSGTVLQNPEQSRRMVDIAISNGERLNRLVNDILDLERIDSGRLHVDLKPHTLSDLVTTAVQEAEGFASAHDIHIRSDIKSADDLVLIDNLRFQQIMANLLSNAIKFSAPGSAVNVRAQSVDDDINISVSDTGIGMDEAFQKRMFDRFAQADPSATRKVEGSGLGLAITRSLIEALNGDIDCASTLGQGTTFTVTLPRRTSEIEQTSDLSRNTA